MMVRHSRYNKVRPIWELSAKICDGLESCAGNCLAIVGAIRKALDPDWPTGTSKLDGTVGLQAHRRHVFEEHAI